MVCFLHGKSDIEVILIIIMIWLDNIFKCPHQLSLWDSRELKGIFHITLAVQGPISLLIDVFLRKHWQIFLFVQCSFSKE